MRIFFSVLLLLAIFATTSAQAVTTDFFNCLHGNGATDCLDHWDGSVLSNGYIAVVIEQDNRYMCFLDEDSAASEVLTGDSPIVAPHTNPGDKRWICAKTGSVTGVLPGNWSDDNGDFRVAEGGRITHSMADVIEFSNDGSVPTVEFLNGTRVLGLPDEQFLAEVQPQDVYDNNASHMLTLCERLPKDFTVTRIMVVCDIDPTAEPTITFYECAPGIGCSGGSTILAATTSAGLLNATGGFTDAGIDAGNKLVGIFSDPDDAINKITILVEGHY